jgi:hypothetical protein
MKRWLIGAQSEDTPAPKKKVFNDKRLSYDKEKRELNFQRNWEEEFSWLEYDKDCNVNKCIVQLVVNFPSYRIPRVS